MEGGGFLFVGVFLFEIAVLDPPAGDGKDRGGFTVPDGQIVNDLFEDRIGGAVSHKGVTAKEETNLLGIWRLEAFFTEVRLGDECLGPLFEEVREILFGKADPHFSMDIHNVAPGVPGA